MQMPRRAPPSLPSRRRRDRARPRTDELPPCRPPRRRVKAPTDGRSKHVLEHHLDAPSGKLVIVRMIFVRAPAVRENWAAPRRGRGSFSVSDSSFGTSMALILVANHNCDLLEIPVARSGGGWLRRGDRRGRERRSSASELAARRGRDRLGHAGMDGPTAIAALRADPAMERFDPSHVGDRWGKRPLSRRARTPSSKSRPGRRIFRRRWSGAR